MSTDTVLVTGALGLVGSAVVRRLADEGRRVVATDVDVRANRKKAARLDRSTGVEMRWADLTDAGAVDALVHGVAPEVIVHLAAVIPPACYANRGLARKVNVGATASLVRAASALPAAPRFLLASSVAVYGARNPHRCSGLLTPALAPDPCDLYGAHKVEAEKLVTGSGLDRVILRLGGVISPTPPTDAGADMMRFSAALPVDGRIQTVDVRDVACAFAAATTTDATAEVFLIGGDDSHRTSHGALTASMISAAGLANALPAARSGDPASDGDWFPTDWVDASRAQEVLAFQHHSLADTLAEARAIVGWRRVPLRVLAPVLRGYLSLRDPYRHTPGEFADVWGAIGRIWGDPSPDAASG